MPEKKKRVEFEKRKRANTGCLRGALYFIGIVIVSAILAVFAWNCANDLLALSKPDHPVTITIAEDFTISELSRTLKEEGVIENAWLFTLYCNFSKAIEKIEPGTHEINANLDYHAIVNSFIVRKERTVVEVQITEGKSLRETLTLISEQGVSSFERLWDAVGTEELLYEFLEDVPMEPGRLEGFMYPDKYFFYSDDSPRMVFSKFLNNFNNKLTNSMRAYLETSEYTLLEILTIASLIELEAANANEKYRISQVIHNRLNSNTLRKLEIDATSVYLVGKENVRSSADVLAAREIDSPYNTFLYEGLPPGPICSPSIESIRAALYPRSDVKGEYFYALNTDREHSFFTTSDAFERFLKSDRFADF